MNSNPPKATPSPLPFDPIKSADLRGSWPAMLRAAQRAREIALQTGTELVVSESGVIRYIRPEPDAAAERVQPPAAAEGDKA